MKVLEFSWKNILSYGNQLQTFQFGDVPQLILVEGENGSGKSTIKEALTVSIYGKSAIRKMKDIPNWINRNAYTQVKFLTTSGDHIEIDRGIDPNFSYIKINGADFNLPDKRKVDEFIEEELTNLPFTVFCNTVSLSFDDFKSFVNLTQADKRKIVDKIFGIDILSDMRAVVKGDLQQVKRDLELTTAKIEKNTSLLTNTRSQLDTLLEKLAQRKDSETSELASKILEKKEEREKTKTNYQSFKQSLDALQKKIDETRDENSKVKATVSTLSEKLEVYSKNRCPHCLNDLTTESSVKTKEAIASKKSILEESLPELAKAFSDYKSQFDKLVADQNLAKSDYYRLDADVTQLESQFAKLSAELKSDESSTITSIIETLQKDLDEDSTVSAKHSEKYSLFATLDSLLSDTGIKKTLIDKIVPTLNHRIQEISEKLEFKFALEFDSDFNPIISYLGLAISPESLSSGQRKKMNLIVLLAFIEIIKMKHSTMNVMFLDEIFSSLDKANVYRAIEILREYSVKHNMTIFVVSHESLPEEFFGAKVIVQSVNHFSEMKTVVTT